MKSVYAESESACCECTYLKPGVCQHYKDDVKRLQKPIYQADLTVIQQSFITAVRAVKKEVGNDLATSREAFFLHISHERMKQK